MTGAALRVLAWLLRRLGAARASNLGGALARTIGPMLPASRVAHHNLSRAFPAMATAERARIVRAVWDNLGRTLAEMPSLALLRETPHGPGYELVRHDGGAIARGGRGGIYLAGHFANWEVTVALSARVCDDFGVLYRAPAHPGTDRFLRGLRAGYGGAHMGQFRKGAEGARRSLAHLRAGHVLGLLADQKANDGIAVPFFGRPAMTAPALAALALKFDVPVVPVRIERLGPARFRVTVHPPMPVPPPGERHARIATMMAGVNRLLEDWARARPEDWLWLHRRWPKE